MISSLYARFLVLMVGGLVSSFLLSNYLWYTVLESKRLAQGREMARDMAFSVGSTMEFIRAYPT